MSDKEHGSSEKTRDTQAQANEQNNTLTSPQDTGQEDAIASEQMKIQTSTPVYSVFSRRMKIFITVISSFGSIISPLSSTIYLPALNALSKDFNVSTSQINLTVTTYSILQGLAPSFYSDFADSSGYRPAIIVAYIIYFAANVGLAVQSSYGALMGLRALQSAGASATIAIRMAVISAIVTPAERGTYLMYARFGTMLAPTFGPVLGGILSQFLGWRSIFWFLAILSGIYIVPYILFVPETNRRIVGNGSIRPRSWKNRCGIDVWHDMKARKRHTPRHVNGAVEPSKDRKWTRYIPRPWTCLTILMYKDVCIALVFSSLLYAQWFMVLSSMSTLLHKYYGYNDLQIGLCYIPMGVGATVGSFGNGKSQDWNFRRLCKKHNIPYDRRKDMDLRNFPIERCRLLPTLPTVLFGVVTCATYGFALQYRSPLAPVLIQQFIIGMSMTGVFGSYSTLIIDLFPNRAATVTAAANIVRCLVGAGAAALVNPIIEAMTVSWAFVFVAAVPVAFAPLVLVQIHFGPRWREERRLKEEQKVREKANASV